MNSLLEIRPSTLAPISTVTTSSSISEITPFITVPSLSSELSWDSANSFSNSLEACSGFVSSFIYIILFFFNIFNILLKHCSISKFELSIK